MSEQNSDVEYLGTTTEDPINNQENHLTTTPPHPGNSSLLLLIPTFPTSMILLFEKNSVKVKRHNFIS